MEVLIILVVAALVIFSVKLVLGRKQSRDAVAEAQEALKILPERFVVLDLETTGLKPDKHEIIEIAAIRVNRDSINHDSFQSLVRPERRVPQKITEMTGITQAMLDEQGEPLEKALREFREFVGDLRLVTFSAEFDMGFLHEASRPHGIEFGNPVSCALQMARRAWPNRQSYRLASLAADGGLDLSEQHRALGDCKRALIVYTAAVAELGRLD